MEQRDDRARGRRPAALVHEHRRVPQHVVFDLGAGGGRAARRGHRDRQSLRAGRDHARSQSRRGRLRARERQQAGLRRERDGLRHAERPTARRTSTSCASPSSPTTAPAPGCRRCSSASRRATSRLRTSCVIPPEGHGRPRCLGDVRRERLERRGVAGQSRDRAVGVPRQGQRPRRDAPAAGESARELPLGVLGLARSRLPRLGLRRQREHVPLHDASCRTPSGPT